jgi:hypothetical protein
MGGVQRSGRVGVATLVLALLALLAVARSTVVMIHLGIAFRDEVDPVSAPLSYYVFVDGGGQLFASAAVALALAAVALLVGVARAGVRMTGWPTVLFAIWALSLVLAALFPADESARIETVGGWVHQFAGGGVLLMFSLAGLAAAPRLAESPAWRSAVPTVRVLSVGAAAFAVAYLLSRLDDLVPGIFGTVDVGGILQRMVLAFDVAVLGALSVHLLRVSWVAVRSGAPAPAGARMTPRS